MQVPRVSGEGLQSEGRPLHDAIVPPDLDDEAADRDLHRGGNLAEAVALHDKQQELRDYSFRQGSLHEGYGARLLAETKASPHNMDDCVVISN